MSTYEKGWPHYAAPDERVGQVRRMLDKWGTLIGMRPVSRSEAYYAFDGHVWLLTEQSARRVGEYFTFMAAVRAGSVLLVRQWDRSEDATQGRKA